MKNFITLWLILLASSVVHGQLERIIHEFTFSDGTSKLLYTKNDQFIIRNSEEVSNGSRWNTVVALDSHGVLKFSYSPGTEFFGPRVHDVIELADTSILYTHFNFGCNGPFNNKISRYDANWDQIYSKGFNGFGKVFIGLFSDNSILYWIPSGNTLLRMNDNVSVYWERDYLWDFDLINSVALLPNDSIVALINYGLQKYLVTITENGDIGNWHPGYDLENIQAMKSGNLIGRKEDSLFILSPSFELINKRKFPNETLLNIATKDQLFAVLTNTPRVYIFNDFLEIEHEFSPTGDNLFDLITFTTNGIALTGRERYGLPEHGKGNYAAFLKTYDLNGNTQQSNRDVGVTSIEMTNTPIVSHPDYYKVLFEGTKITIRNFSDSILEQVNLNIDLHALDTGCLSSPIWYQRFTKRFENLSLTPDGEKELVWDSIEVAFMDDPAGLLELCVWTSMPDLKLDKNNANDLYCSGFVVGVLEVQTPFSFQIFPNPSTTETTLTYRLPPGKKGEVLIINALGSQLAEYPVTQSEGSLALPDYPSGLYFVSLLSEGRVLHTERLLKF